MRSSGGGIGRFVILPVVALALVLSWTESRAAEGEQLAEYMAAAAGRRVPDIPAVTDPDLIALTEQLAGIVRTHDASALIAMASPDIELSFGGDNGVEALREIVAESWFWTEFRTAVEGGGVLATDWPDGRAAVFPAIVETWPHDLDPFEYVYGNHSDAVMRAAPDDGAEVIATSINGMILTVGPPLPEDAKLFDEGWYHVCLQETGCGFARVGDVRSPLDWHAIFTQRKPGTRWVFEAFLAGD